VKIKYLNIKISTHYFLIEVKTIDINYILAKLIKKGRLLSYKNYVVGASGNISGRLSRDHIIIKKTGRRMSNLKPNDLLIVDLWEKTIQGASSDYFIHRELYLKYPEINYVVHAHPPNIVRYSLNNSYNNIPIETYEGSVYIGKKLYIYRGPHEEVVENTIFFRGKNWGYVIEAGHGVYVFGKDIDWIINMIEEIEYIAKVK